MRQFLYGIGLLLAAAVLVWIDQSPSDVANQASLLILLIGAGLLGIAAPQWAWLPALMFVVAGTTIALHPGGSGSETHTGLGFEVQDLDAALQRVIQVGGRITSSPQERAQERIRVAEIADTEDNLITVAELIN